MISTYSSRSVFLLGLVSSLQYLKNLASLANSYNSQIRATVFIVKRSCPSRFFLFTIYSSSSACFWNNGLRFIVYLVYLLQQVLDLVSIPDNFALIDNFFV